METSIVELREKLRVEKYKQLRDLAKFFEENNIKHITENDGDMWVETIWKIKETLEIVEKCSDYSLFLNAMEYSDDDKIIKQIQRNIL